MSFVLGGEVACCGVPPRDAPELYKRESNPAFRRRSPPLSKRRAQLEEQEGRCFYCEQTLSESVFRNGRAIKLKIEWDHQVPFSYTQNNSENNFVAACHVCNRIKSDRVFQTVEAARVFIETERREKGYY